MKDVTPELSLHNYRKEHVVEKERIMGNIDHVVFAVQDMETAIQFFSDLLNTEFVEIGS